MMYFMQMMLAFLCLFFIICFWKNMLSLPTMEASFVAIFNIVVCLWIGGKLGSFTGGMCLLYVIAAVGLLTTVFAFLRMSAKKKRVFRKRLFAPAFVVLFGVFVLSVLLTMNDEIQHIDELHFWAYLLKYMYANDVIPNSSDIVGGNSGNPYFTILFYMFFQKIAGFSDAAIYASSSLLFAAGALLPFSNVKWMKWKKVTLYAVVLYVACFSLYVYSSKNCYVDIQVAALAGGMISWWTKRRRVKTDWVILAMGMLALYWCKPYVGFMMVVLVLFFVAAYEYAIASGRYETEDGFARIKRRSVALIGIFVGFVLLGSFLLYQIDDVTNQEAQALIEAEAEAEGLEDAELLEDSVKNSIVQKCISKNNGVGSYKLFGLELPKRFRVRLDTVGFNKEKMGETTASMLQRVIGAAFNKASNLKLSFVVMMMFLGTLVWVIGELSKKQRRYQLYGIWMGFFALLYIASLYFAYLLIFVYSVGSETASYQRYGAICVLVLFVFAMSQFFMEDYEENEKQYKYATLIITAVFVYGLNTSYITSSTSLDLPNVTGYQYMYQAKEEINYILDNIGSKSKVYVVNQKDYSSSTDMEYYMAAMAYEGMDRVSSYCQYAYRFTEDGTAYIGLEEVDYVTDWFLFHISVLDEYDYLWVINTDNYFTEFIQSHFPNVDIVSGGLYKIHRDDDGIIDGLTFVTDSSEVTERVEAYFE